MKRHKLTYLTSLLLIVLSLTLPAVVLAAAPSNDDFANAETIGALPVTVSVDNTEATTEASEPLPCGYTPFRTVWYTFTPSVTARLRLTVDSSFYYHGIQLYEAFSSPADMTQLAALNCIAFGGGSTIFTAEAGKTYYLQASSLIESSYGTLTLSLSEIAPPPNDAFATAPMVMALPYQDTVDLSAASLEPGEPTPSCVWPPDFGRTVWYAYTPTASQSLTMWTDLWSSYSFAVYTGPGLEQLTPVACRNAGRLTFFAQAGVTYYFQLGLTSDYTSNLTFQLDVAAQPTADYGYGPWYPNVYDTVSFFSSCYDPAEADFSTIFWQFSDGATAEGYTVTHNFAADGDYAVSLTCTTVDGRVAGITKTHSVRTHDIAIVRLAAPQSVKVGQTRAIKVSVRNNRYDEIVLVTLYKSVSGGSYIPVGTLTQAVPVRPGKHTTDFTFNHTFVQDDAALGKVTFKAIATLDGPAPDALLADNEAISTPPTRVMR